MADYYSTITNKGAELEAAATANGTTVNLTQFVITDGGGQLFNPDPALTALPNEVYRSAISGKSVSQEQLSQIVLQLVLPAELPADVDEFTVRGIGILTDAGELYAVSNCPAIEKPKKGVNINLNFRLAVSPTSDIVLVATTGDGLFLRQDANLSDVNDKEKARENLELKSAALVNAQESVGDAEPGKALISGMATAENVGAVSVEGGDVGYLDNAGYYAAKSEGWQGAGAWASQFSDPTAPFFKRYSTAPGAPSTYHPLIKGSIQTEGAGFAAVVSFGILTKGGDNFPDTCIHSINDRGQSSVWSFGSDAAFRSPGAVYAESAILTTNGDVSGTVWGGWLSAWLGNNTVRADYVNQRIGDVQNWALGTFVSDFSHTAPQEIQFWDGRGYPKGTDGGAMYNISFVGGGNNVGSYQFRYDQIARGGAWYVVG
jgi:hypothetical protein